MYNGYTANVSQLLNFNTAAKDVFSDPIASPHHKKTILLTFLNRDVRAITKATNYFNKIANRNQVLMFETSAGSDKG